MRYRWAFTLLMAAAAACSSESAPPLAPLDVPDGCQPLFASDACFLPFPSDFYTTPDPAQTTGRRVEMQGAAKLLSRMGADADVVTPARADGFSLSSTIVATLPSELATDGLPNLMDDPARSATLDSPTLLVEAATGKLVPHFVDLDLRPTDPARRAIVLRAFAPLLPRTRYIVAFTGVHASDGTLAPAPEGFRRLRDNAVEPGRDPALAALAPRYETDVLAPLQNLGVARGSLQLAWDFTTGTPDHPIRDMLAVRTQTLAFLAANPPAVKITSVANGTGSAWKTVRGTLTAPMFVDSANAGARLLRDANGTPRRNGTVDVPFYVTIPTAVRDDYGPGRVFAYGHGFFGGTSELDGAGALALGTTLHAVEFGVDWWGMAKDDLGVVANAIASTPARTPDFAERVHQAMANWMTLTRAMTGALTQAAELSRPMSGDGVHTMGAQSDAGQLLYDPSTVYYFGASQGSILGSVLAALDPELTRVVLNVGGAPFSHLMSRAGPFGPFFVLANGSMGETLKAQALIAMLQLPLDTIDPASFAPHVLHDGLPGSPADRRVLIQAGLGDQGVPNLGTFYYVRELGVPMTSPSPSAEPFIPQAPPAGLTSAFTLWDYGVDVSQYRKPGTVASNVVHDTLRLEPSALRQIDAFCKPGTASAIIHPCAGPCDPE